MGFTGIVQDKGTVVSVKRDTPMKLWDGSNGSGMVLRISPNNHKLGTGHKILLEGKTYIGESICVEGVCLTVTAFNVAEGWFEVNVAKHSCNITTFGMTQYFNPGQTVNLENAAVKGQGNSGHEVEGHVDGTAKILKMEKQDDMLLVDFEIPKELRGLIVKKGYVSVDGVSLTVKDVSRETFGVMLIAHTQKSISLPSKQIGGFVNVEAHVLGKYIKAYLDATAHTGLVIKSVDYNLGEKIRKYFTKVNLSLGLAMGGFIISAMCWRKMQILYKNK